MFLRNSRSVSNSEAEHEDSADPEILCYSLQGFAIGKKLIEDAFVHHFTAETKPCVSWTPSAANRARC